MNKRVYNAIRKQSSDRSFRRTYRPYDDPMLREVDKLLEEYIDPIHSQIADIPRVHVNDDKILDNMKQRADGKAIGASLGGLGGIIAGLLLAKDKDLLHKILYSGGLGLLSAGAGSVLGDTISDYAFKH